MKNVMKNRFSLFLLILFTMMTFTSCEEEVDADKYNHLSTQDLPVLSAYYDSLTFDRVYLTTDMELKGDTNIIEHGFFMSTQEDFPTESTRIIQHNKAGATFSMLVDKLIGSTTYYYKAYTFSENGFSFSQADSFTTDEPPVFEDTYLFGSYNQIDNSIQYGQINGEENGYWDQYGYLTISQVENTYNQIEIYNFWGYGRTIIGVIDFEKKEISISPQEIAASANHGSIIMYLWSYSEGNMQIHLEENVVATYDEEGNIIMPYWGGFAFYEGSYYPYEACYETILIKKDL